MPTKLMSRYCFLLSILSLFIAPSLAGREIFGQVIDLNRSPVAGATVLLTDKEHFHTGSSSDSAGFFRFIISDSLICELELNVSSIGYRPAHTCFRPHLVRDSMQIRLEEMPLQLRKILVAPGAEERSTKFRISTRDIEKAGSRSLVMTNPAGAINSPQFIRAGSNYSSKIRASGSSPVYYINDLEIGPDPNHFGMFTFIPSTILKSIEYYPMGTPACYQYPAAILFKTGGDFVGDFSGNLNLSLIEATGTFNASNEKAFLNGSLRKSVLDKLVSHFDFQSNRMTLPPTNFQDVFVSSGVRLSPNTRLFSEQYFVRDVLSFNSGATEYHPQGILTQQRTGDNYLNLRLEKAESNLLLKVGAALRTSDESYLAFPLEQDKSSAFHVQLQSNRTIYTGDMEISFFGRDLQLSVGTNVRLTAQRRISLSQVNWNFLPPDAASDISYIYQDDLNNDYGFLEINDREIGNGAYGLIRRTIGRFELESGFRLEYFSNLSQKLKLVQRHSLNIQTGEKTALQFFYGRFAESPTNRILEPYQVLIHYYQDRLLPVETDLYSVKFTMGVFKAGLFRKEMRHLPFLTPNFMGNAENKSPAEPFLTIRPFGKVKFYGGDITVEIKNLLNDRLSFFGYYGYAHADKIYEAVTVPYELNIPHKIYSRLGYQFSRTIYAGLETTVHSGYRYTPDDAEPFSADRNGYDYYSSRLQDENSAQFPAHILINLSLSYQTGNLELFATVANLTNHNNAIINSAYGFIYEAGILPIIGMKYKF